MSYDEYAAPLRLELGRSPGLALVFSLLHLGALPLITVIQVPAALKALAATVVVCTLAWSLGRHAMRWSKEAVRELVWEADGRWCLRLNGGRELVGRLRPDSYVHPRLAILNFNVEGRRRDLTVLVTADGLRSGSFRQLRVRLRLAAGSLAEQAQY